MIIRVTQFLTLLMIASYLTACGSDSNSENSNTLASAGEPVTSGTWYLPTITTTWQWQLLTEEGVSINSSYDVDLYDIDLFDVPTEKISELKAAGRKVICYFSAGSYEQWRDDAGQFSAQDLGNTLDGWEGERWLDIRSQAVLDIMKARMDLAAEKGCDGVEPDNMDAYTPENNAGFDLSAADQLNYNKHIANEAHLRNLSVGLKNDLDQITALVPYYDFAVNEQCFEYNECDALAFFIIADKPVFNAEYAQKYVDNLEGAQDTLCVQSQSEQIQTLVLPLDLDDSSRISCF